MVLQRCLNFSVAIKEASTFLGARMVWMILKASFRCADVCTFVTGATWLCLVTCRNVEAEANALPIWCGTRATLQCKWKLAGVPLLAFVALPLLLLPALPRLVGIPLLLFKVTFIYRKFINSYTDKFIILERDISIYIYIMYIYIHIFNSYLNSY